MTSFTHLFDQYQPELAALGVSTAQAEALLSFMERLWQANLDLNLVSRNQSTQSLMTHHLLDCLLALPHLPAHTPIIDLGSGGGFPAVPLAICLPDVPFTLYEKSPLKLKFLETLRDLCPNITLKGLLEPGSSLGSPRELVIARGFKSIASILQLTAGHLHADGAYLLYKGRLVKIDEELRAVRQLRPARTRIVALEPFGDIEERHLIWINGPSPVNC